MDCVSVRYRTVPVVLYILKGQCHGKIMAFYRLRFCFLGINITMACKNFIDCKQKISIYKIIPFYTLRKGWSK